MELYLMRHGIAADRADGRWSRDSERPLTEEGIAKMREIAKGLSAAGVAFDTIISSPLVRARETAGIVARVQGSAVEVEETAALAAGATSPAAVYAAIGKGSKDARILLVGHEPDLGLLAAALLGLPAASAIPFKKGGALRIDVGGMPPQEPGVLVWMLTPRLARSLRG